MSNKLKRIFSDGEIVFNGKINFTDHEGYKKFLEALESVQEDGKFVKVNGVDSIKVMVRNGEALYPIDEHDNISEIYVTPSIEDVSFELETKYGKKVLVLKRFRINKGIVLQTQDDAIVFFKLIFEDETTKTKITYRAQPEKAKSVEELIEYYSMIISFFNKLFIQDVEKIEDGLPIKNMKDYFEASTEKYEKLRFIEKEFCITFKPEDLIRDESCWLEVEEIFMALYERMAIRLNAQINESETTGMKINQQIDRIKVGEELDITFTTKVEYTLWSNNIQLFAACLLSNAVIKEINQVSDEEIKIIYGNEDSRPMYISYKGFKTEEDAQEEMMKIMSNKEEYSKALTVVEYISQGGKVDER